MRRTQRATDGGKAIKIRKRSSNFWPDRSGKTQAEALFPGRHTPRAGRISCSGVTE